MTVDPAWVVAGVAILIAIVLGAWLWATRKSQIALSDTAAELAEIHRGEVRKRTEADYAAAVTAGELAVAEADAKAEREVLDGTNDAGTLANHLDGLNRSGGGN